MNEKILHRGPDAEGIFVEGDVALGQRRLSIIDLQEVINLYIMKIKVFLLCIMVKYIIIKN